MIPDLKIGDIAYGIRNYRGHRTIQKGFVSEIYFDNENKLCAVIKFVNRGPLGEKVFKTAEEARAKLQEKKEDPWQQ